MLVYSKGTQSTAILAVREFQRASLVGKLGNDWTETRIGMFFSAVDGNEDNLIPPEETLAVADVSDYLTIGLKDSLTYSLPGELGASFIGVRSTGATSKAGPGWLADSAQQCSAVGYNGVSLVNAGVLSNGPLLFPDPEPDSGYSGFYCLKFVVINRGMATQSVSVSATGTAQVSGADYGKSALYQAINNGAFGLPKSVAWNNGVSATTLPDAAWLRIPFYNVRIRIQQIMAIKILP